MNKQNKNIPPWVFGLKENLILTDWYRDVAFIILKKYEKIPRRPRTEEAEIGLSIPPSWYSYIGRAAERYGNGIFFFKVETDKWDSDQRGVCPFDTGGLWHGKIKLSIQLDSRDEKVDFFNLYDKLLKNWDNHFREYINLNYNTYNNYVNGFPPDINNGVVEIDEENNDSIAWTWEGRIEKELFSANSEVTDFFCSDEKFYHLEEDIKALPILRLDEKEKLTEWLINYSTVSYAFDKGPTQLACEKSISIGY
ncbi:hypothetical protein ACFL4T_01470 [candidate division KSB1 bacterium]